jgi:IS5 family transposase
MTLKRPPDTRNQANMFRSRLDNIVNPRHPLFRLANKIDWDFFAQEFGPLYVEKVGRPGLPIRSTKRGHLTRTSNRASGWIGIT